MVSYGELTDRLVRSCSVLLDVIINNCLSTLILGKRLVLSVLLYELCGHLHDRVLDAGPGKILDLTLRGSGRRILESSIIASSLILHTERYRIISLASIVGRLLVKIALATHAGPFGVA